MTLKATLIMLYANALSVFLLVIHAVLLLER